MSESDYSQTTALVWDELYKNRVDDINFYVNIAQDDDCKSILEFGSGTGRIAIPIAISGTNVVGCEISHHMLKIAKEKIDGLPVEIRERITILQADMRTYVNNERFDMVIIPFNTLNLLSTRQDQKDVLSAACKCLRDGGKLVFDIQNPERGRYRDRFDNPGFLRPSGREWIDPDSGNRVVEWFSRKYDLVEQTMHETQIWEELDNNNVVIKRYYRDRWNRYTFRYEIEYLLNMIGFELLKSFGGFHFEAIDSESEQLIFVAKKKL